MKTIFSICFLMCVLGLIGIEIEPISSFCDSDVYSKCYTNFIEYNGDLYTLSNRALTVFEIENGQFNLISELEIPGVCCKLDHIDEIFYVSTGLDKDFFRINYNDPYNPVITDTLFDIYGSHSFFCNDDKVFIHEYDYNDYGISLHVFDSETFNELDFIEYPVSNVDLFPVKENVVFSRDHSQNIVFYDISDYNNMIELGNLHCNNILAPPFMSVYQDTIFALKVSNGILLINISDLENPVIIDTFETTERSFHIDGNNLITFGHDTMLSIYDISDIYNITLLQHFDYPNFKGFANCETYEDRIFISQAYGEIDIYETNGNVYSLIDSYKNFGGLFFSFYLNNYGYIGSYKSGIITWDLNDIYNPILTSIFQPQNNYFEYMACSGNKICGLTYNEEISQYANEILEIQQDGSIINRYTIEYDINNNSQFCAGEEDYIFNIENGNFQRLFLNEDNELIFENSVSLPQHDWAMPSIINNNAFISSILQTIIIEDIYGDFNEDDITVFPGNFTSEDKIHAYGNYIFISNEIENSFNTTILKYNDEEGFQYFSTLENSGVIAIDESNDLLFVSWIDCTVYDLSNIESNILPEIFSFDQTGFCEDISLFEKDGDLCIFYLNQTDAEILVYDPDNSDNTNDETISLSAKISNNPNPFILGSNTRSLSTEICLNLSDPKEKYFVDIFNIKGQHIRSIEVDNFQLNNEVEVSWDGLTQHNQKVGSGVYLITLNDGSEIIASKKCMVLK